MLRQPIAGLLRRLTQWIDRKRIGNQPFVIVSNNCWGAELYKHLKREYNTPFVGLFLHGPDFIALLNNWNHYLNLELQFTSISKWIDQPIAYPIGLLGDVEIHFMHYASAEEAQSKWTRRLARMQKLKDLDQYFFRCCDRDGGTVEVLEQFHQLPFRNKLSFGIQPISSPQHVVLRESENGKMVEDGVKMYRYCYRYIDLIRWMKTGQMGTNAYSRWKSNWKIS